MKYLIIVIILLPSCLHRNEHVSYENGVVISKHYQAEYQHTYYTSDQFYDGNKYVCCTLNQHTTYYPAEYITVFQCDHNAVFKIDREDVFLKLKEKDTVIIKYFDLLNKDNEVKDYEFIDANVKNKNW